MILSAKMWCKGIQTKCLSVMGRCETRLAKSFKNDFYSVFLGI